MGQKVNPKIFRLGIRNTQWNSRFFEKKQEEFTLYNYQTIKIQSYIRHFLYLKGIIVQNIKIFFNENNLYIFISYFITRKSLYLIKKDRIKTLNIKKIVAVKIKKSIVTKLITTLEKLKKTKRLKKKLIVTQNELKRFWNRFYLIRKKYVTLHSTKRRQTRISYYFKSFKYRKKLKEILNKRLKKYKIGILQNYINSVYYKKYKNNVHLKKSSYMEGLLESLSLFTHKKYNIFITFKHLNRGISLLLSKEEKMILKKRILLLKKYKKEKFFKDSTNIVLTLIKIENSSKLFSEYIAQQLKKLKKHNYFLNFLKQIIKIFMSIKTSKIKGIKIKISGRFNGAPRAKHRIMTLGRIPIQTINKQIDYNEATSFTKNGTFGIKLWINYG